MASEPPLIKVCLTNQGEDIETPWAHDLGPAPDAPPGSRQVRLVNVPFMHAKPTWGDTIVVSPGADGILTWDRSATPWPQIGTRLVEDGGRWAMIVDYLPRPDLAEAEAFQRLNRACDAARVVCEGAWGPRDQDLGRVYLAVPRDLSAEAVMARLHEAALPMQLVQIHPEPRRPRTSQTMVGITPEEPRKPASSSQPLAIEVVDGGIDLAADSSPSGALRLAAVPRTRSTTHRAAPPPVVGGSRLDAVPPAAESRAVSAAAPTDVSGPPPPAVLAESPSDGSAETPDEVSQQTPPDASAAAPVAAPGESLASSALTQPEPARPVLVWSAPLGPLHPPAATAASSASASVVAATPAGAPARVAAASPPVAVRPKKKVVAAPAKKLAGTSRAAAAKRTSAADATKQAGRARAATPTKPAGKPSTAKPIAKTGKARTARPIAKTGKARAATLKVVKPVDAKPKKPASKRAAEPANRRARTSAAKPAAASRPARRASTTRVGPKR